MELGYELQSKFDFSLRPPKGTAWNRIIGLSPPGGSKSVWTRDVKTAVQSGESRAEPFGGRSEGSPTDRRFIN